MYIRVFATEDRGVLACLNFLRLEMGARDTWEIELCDPYRWTPTTVADIHLHIDTPLRLAIPWARFNAFSALYTPYEWEWTKKEMNMTVDRDALEERSRGIKALRGLITAARRSSNPTFNSLPGTPNKTNGAEPPKVGVITVTRNRADWWPNMIRNVLTQDWPISRLEWIIVDDSDAGQNDLTAAVATLRQKQPLLTVKYVRLTEETTIGEKRNMAVRAAADDTSVFVCMDDDDHYPPTSISKRVAWISPCVTASPCVEIVYCAMLPMYDARKYISAISVPPFDADPSQRVSEASLCFTRGAWSSQQFPDIFMAEGEFFLFGRIHKSVEIPPTGVIVSFIHGGNTSSRRVPEDQPPNGSHYGFPDDYFEWLTRIAQRSSVLPRNQVVAVPADGGETEH